MAESKEIAERAFRREKTERIPVGIFLGGSWPIIHSDLTLEGLIGDPVKTAKVFAEVNERLGADIIMTGTGATALIIKALGGEVRFDAKGAPQIVSELIKKEEDLEDLKVSTATNDPALVWLRDTARELIARSGEKNLILASGRAPFTLAAQLYGLENFLKALYKNQSFARKLLEFTTALSTDYFIRMIKEGKVHGAFIADPTASGDVISKSHFEEFVLPYTKRVVKAVKDLNKPVMLHICGDIGDRLHLIAETGIDSLSLDTKVDIGKAVDIIGTKVSIAGNVDPVGVLEFGSREEILQAAWECLEKGTQKGGFILMPGCDLATGVSEENIKAFTLSTRMWKAANKKNA